jgi:hypothetical protein
MSPRYIGIFFSIIVLMIAYVWLYIEVVKTKLDYARLYQKEKELIQENDHLRLAIEKERTIKKIRERARGLDVETVSPSRMTVIVMKKADRGEKK